MTNVPSRVLAGVKSLLYMGTLLALIAASTPLQSSAHAAQTAQTPAAGLDQHRAMLSTYCFTCHNSRAKVGGLALDSLDLHAAANDARTWEKVLRKLRGHLMPPPGNRQPPQTEVDAFV